MWGRGKGLWIVGGLGGGEEIRNVDLIISEDWEDVKHAMTPDRWCQIGRAKRERETRQYVTVYNIVFESPEGQTPVASIWMQLCFGTETERLKIDYCK